MEKRLQILISELNLKNKDLALELGVSPNAITEVLKGRTKHIPTKWIIYLVEKYNVNSHWLLTGQGDIFINFEILNKEKSQITKILEKLNQHQVQSIYEYISFLDFKNSQKSRLNQSSISGLSEKNIEIPVLGDIAAGIPVLAQENIEKTIQISTNLIKTKGKLFGLQVQGDSMKGAGIYDKDVAILKQTNDLSEVTGKIAAILIENEATLKFLIKENDKIILKPANPDYQIIELQETDNPRILGLLVGLVRNY